MVKPACFGFNPETAATNAFQHQHEESVHALALNEFEGAVLQLANAGITLEVFEDDMNSPLPDSIFPNNWFSTHHPTTLVLYPMLTKNRRAERKAEFINKIRDKFGYSTTHDLTGFERENKFLEGTGSMVLDHDQHVAFACLSPRTNTDVLLDVCERIGYLPVVFEARDTNGIEIYHTNVMLALSDKLAVCCFETIVDESDREGIRSFLQKTGKSIVEISMRQMESFAGNVLFAANDRNQICAAISTTAWESLDDVQRKTISSHSTPIIISIPTIERHGGGGIRCMLAELF